MLTWVCPRGHSNSESGTCSQCGHPASAGELRHARRKHETARWFARGLPAMRDGDNWHSTTDFAALLLAAVMLLQLVPGLVTAAPDLTNAPTLAGAVPPDSPLAGVRVFQPTQPAGLLRLVSPLRDTRVYMTVPEIVPPPARPMFVAVDTRTLTLGQLPDRELEYITTVKETGEVESYGAELVPLRQGNYVYVLPVEGPGPVNQWAMSGAVYRIPPEGSLPLAEVETFLKMARWPSLPFSIVMLLLATLGFFVANRPAARSLVGTTAGLLTLAVLLPSLAGYVGEALGRWASQPAYPSWLAVLLSSGCIVAAVAIASAVKLAAHWTFSFLVTHEDVTWDTWFGARLATAVCLPLLVLLGLTSLDALAFAIAPGLSL